MTLARSSGVLLHVTSLPGGEGIGDLGGGARRWLDWLRRSGCGLWQILPLGPVGAGWSPYQSPSTFAGNPLLISLRDLVDEGWLALGELGEAPGEAAKVDFPGVAEYKSRLLHAAVESWRSRGRPDRSAFEEWCEAEKDWLEDFALFMAIKEAHSGEAWTAWGSELARRLPAALATARKDLAGEIEVHKCLQFWFWSQWHRLHDAAERFGIRIVGDLPIYVAFDSADVWANPELFQLDEDGRPVVVAGVPPDYFSETGQLWSNPIYRWERHAQDGFRWWIERVRRLSRCVDVTRIDHFRGLEAYWEIPAGAATAATGRWVPGPGADLLEALRRGLEGLPIIAEDLGVVTPGVQELLEKFELPGMKVLQFGLEGGETDGELPAEYPVRCVAYTGTHDNDTCRGWFDSADEGVRAWARRALAAADDEISWRMVEALWQSPAVWTLAPLQDLLSLGGEARMNYPGRGTGNWTWRATGASLDDALADRLAALNQTHGRLR